MLAKILRGENSDTHITSWPLLVSDEEAKWSGAARTTTNNPESEGLFDAAQRERNVLEKELIHLRADVERREREAFLKGKNEGDQQARSTIEQQWEAQVSQIRSLLSELQGLRPQLRRQTEEELVRLAISVARRILHRELTVDPDALTGLVKAAFEKVEQYEIQQIRTDPQSVELVRRAAQEVGRSGSIRVVADPSLRLGSLLIEFPKGQLDASVETQLKEIERGFVDLVRHS